MSILVTRWKSGREGAIFFLLLLFACDQQTPTNLRNKDQSNPCMTSEASADSSFKKQDCFQYKTINGNEDATADQKPSLGESEILPLKDEEVAIFLRQECSACHNQQDGLYSSFWALNPATFNTFELRTDPLAPNVYYSLFHRARGIITAKPSAMPPGELDNAKGKQLERLLRWFQVETPMIVQAAVHRYGGNLEDHNVTGDYQVNYQCKSAISNRRFLHRLTQDLFNRNPSQMEIQQWLGKKAELPSEQKFRRQIVDQIFANQAYLSEFESVGLKRFAQKVSGAFEISDINGTLLEPQVEDLRLEFYEYVLKYYTNKSWRDILLQDVVMVTSNTAPLYENCQFSGQNWGECALQSPRGSFFSTAGFLASKPTSFLSINNNYGRVALMHYTISGSVFKPATDGPSGDSPNPLPSCLKSADWRGTKSDTSFAPFGSMTIPAFGNVCQSCHIDRQLAAGSILFRPYAKAGGLLNLNNYQDDSDYPSAVEPSRIVRIGLQVTHEQAVTDEFLESLLKSKKDQACVAGGGPNKGDLILPDLRSFAVFLMSDGKILADGLARHIPRALGNVPTVTEEIINEVGRAYESSGGKLLPSIKAYLTSETYSCDAKEL